MASFILFVGTAIAGNVGGAAACFNDGSRPLSLYTAAGYECAIGPTKISNVTFGGTALAGTPTVAGVDDLNLTVNWNPFSYIVTVRLEGFTPFTVGVGQTTQYLFGFTLDPGDIMESEAVSEDPPFGFIPGSQTYCPDGLFGRAGGCVGPFNPVTFGFDNNTPGFSQFPRPLAILDTDTTITLNPNGDTPSGLDGLVFDIQTTAPEPGTWALLVSGLAGLAVVSRRRRQGPLPHGRGSEVDIASASGPTTSIL